MRAARTLIVLAAALAGAAVHGQPAANRQGIQAAPAAAAQGHAIFAKWCAPCHAPAPRLAGTLALQDKYKGSLPAALEQRADLTPEIVAYFVRNGVAWMAPFRKTEISDAELAALATYLAAGPKGRAR